MSQNKSSTINPNNPSVKRINTEEILHFFEHIVKLDKTNEKPLFVSIKHDFLNRIIKRIETNPSKPITMAVAGMSASGKTTFVNCLVASLANKHKDITTVVTSDNYFIDTSEELKEAGSFQGLLNRGFNFDIPEAINLDLMKKHIEILSNGEPIQGPKYDFVTCASIEDGEIKKPAPLIIAEGLFVLKQDLADVFDVCIYVEAPQEVIKDRWYKRAKSRGKTGHAADQWFEKTTNEAQKHIKPTKENADIVVNGLVHAEYIEFVANAIFRIF